jgi:3-phenylpropionate/trans-cinnamate dioxygenase ferredoxin subunit
MERWLDIGAADECPPGTRRLVWRDGREVALFNVDGCLYALEDRCPHAGASLAMGRLDGTRVTCRAHGLSFDLGTGCMRGDDGLRARTYSVRVREGRIEVDLAERTAAAQS